MTDQLPRRIPEWLSLADISRAWSEETGEDAAAFEQRFRDWFRDYLVRNAYVEAGAAGQGGDDGVPAELLEGRQIWRETFETFCEESGLAKPRFWFPEAGRTRVTPEPAQGAATAVPSAAEPATRRPFAPQPNASEPNAAEPITEAAARKPEEAPPRRRAREGGASFTWIAAGLVVAVVAGLVTLWLQGMEGPVAEPEAAQQSDVVRLATVEPPSMTPAPSETIVADPAATLPAADEAAPAAGQSAPETNDAPAAAGDAPPETGDATAETMPVSPVSPEPTSNAEPAAAQVAAATAEEGARTETATAPPAAAAAPTKLAANEPVDEGLVLLIQRELRAAGYDPGPLDGKRGPKFAAAISAYQRANDLPVDGRASFDLLSRLARENLKAGRSAAFAPAPVVKGSPELDPGAETGTTNLGRKAALQAPPIPARPAPEGRALVRAIQARLTARGYYDGPVDGSLGPKTREAIQTYQRAQRYEVTGQPSRALYDELEEHALEVQGLDQFRQGAYEAAVVTYSRIIQRKPKDADAYFNRGLAYKNSGRTDQALADYEMAIELDAAHRKAHFDRANILYQRGLYREAVQDYFKALTLWLGLS